MLDGLYEHSPWIARQALASRPFARCRSCGTRCGACWTSRRRAGLALIRAHPELAGRAMQDNSPAAESTNEQDKAGLTHCSPEELARLRQLNADYLARFDFPFILAVRGPRGIGLTRGQIIATFERRLDNPPDVEFREALRNIHRIVEIRLADKFGLDLSLGNDIWDWHERLSVHSDPLRRTGPAHRHLPDGRAPRLRPAHQPLDARLRLRRSRDRRRRQRGRPLPRRAVRRRHADDRQPLRHGAQRRQVRRPAGHLRAHGACVRNCIARAAACRITWK